MNDIMQTKHHIAIDAVLLFVGLFLAIAAVDRLADAWRYGIGAGVFLVGLWLAYHAGRFDAEMPAREEGQDAWIDESNPSFVVRNTRNGEWLIVDELGVGIVCKCFDDTGREANIIADLLNKRGGL